MRKILFLCFFLALIAQSFAQKSETREIPAEDLKIRDALEADPSILLSDCAAGRRPFSKISEKETVRVRMLAYEASLANDKIVKLKKICSTVEGTKIASYLTVENGRIKIISDYSRDRFGPARVFTRDCRELRLGTYNFDETKKAMIFTPVAKKEDLGENIPFFECVSENRNLVF